MGNNPRSVCLGPSLGIRSSPAVTAASRQRELPAHRADLLPQPHRYGKYLTILCINVFVYCVCSKHDVGAPGHSGATLPLKFYQAQYKLLGKSKTTETLNFFILTYLSL